MSTRKSGSARTPLLEREGLLVSHMLPIVRYRADAMKRRRKHARMQFKPTRTAQKYTSDEFKGAQLNGESAEATLQLLVAAVARRDPSALAAIHGLTGVKMHAIARRILRNRSDAEEVVFDVLWRVWQRAGEFDPCRGTVFAWLVVMCRTRAIDRLRSSRSSVRNNRNGNPEPNLGGTYDSCPREAMEIAETGMAVAVAMARLPPIRRTLLTMAFSQELTHPQIAASTSLALGTVKSHLRRAIRTLRETLGKNVILRHGCAAQVPKRPLCNRRNRDDAFRPQ